MARALHLARHGLYTTSPNPRVGCVVVKASRVLGEGYHRRAGGPHAEVLALAAAGPDARGATAYVTLEPCSHRGRTPPCAEALVTAGVSRVVIASEDPNPLVAGAGVSILRQAGIVVDSGILAGQARALNCGFYSRMTRARPWVRVKSAISLDGRTALASGESTWITGDDARRDVQFLRARACVVMTGSGTALADDPALNVRLSAKDLGIEGEVRQPMRVVLDSRLRLPPTAGTFQLPGHCLVLAEQVDPRNRAALEAIGVEVAEVGARRGGIDLRHALELLADREVNEVHVEAGPTLVGGLFEERLVDEFVVYVAPRLLGDAGRGLATLPGIRDMGDRLGLSLTDLRHIGRDLRLDLRPVGEA